MPALCLHREHCRSREAWPPRGGLQKSCLVVGVRASKMSAETLALLHASHTAPSRTFLHMWLSLVYL